MWQIRIFCEGPQEKNSKKLAGDVKSVTKQRQAFADAADVIPIRSQDDLKVVRIVAERRTEVCVEQPKTSQRRESLEMELELPVPEKRADF